MTQPASPSEVRFVSLFVKDLQATVARLAPVFGVAPSAPSGQAPDPHPFASAGPVEFALGSVCIAIYQAAPTLGTHPGDIAIGLVSDDVGGVATTAAEQGNRVFFGPRAVPPTGRELAVFVTPDKHFFEVIGEPGEP